MFSSLAVHRRPGKQKPQSKESRWCSEKWCHWPQTDCNTRADTVHFLRFFPKKDWTRSETGKSIASTPHPRKHGHLSQVAWFFTDQLSVHVGNGKMVIHHETPKPRSGRKLNRSEKLHQLEVVLWPVHPCSTHPGSQRCFLPDGNSKKKKKKTGSFFEYIFWKTLPTAKCNKHEHWKSSALTLLVSNAATLPCNTPINCHPGCIWKTYRNRIHFGREILFGRKAFDKLGKRDLNNRLTFELWITW